MSRIVAKIAVDQDVLDDSIQASLCEANIVKVGLVACVNDDLLMKQALMGCYDLDKWLAAHLGDIFDKLVMIPDDEERYVGLLQSSSDYRFEVSLRDYLILEYAEVLQTNPKHAAFWRVTCDYLAAAGDEGRNRLRSHILHVGLGLLDPKGKGKGKSKANGDARSDLTEEDHDMDSGVEAEASASGADPTRKQTSDDGAKSRQRFEHFEDLREACHELRLEDEWKMISRIMADKMMRRGEYGIAATMCLQAEDGFALSQIADKIVDAFVQHGESFSRHGYRKC